MTVDSMTSAPAFAAFSAEARALLGAAAVSTAADELDLMATDFSEITLARPALIVRPGSAEDVVHLVRAAARHGIPLVPRGGGMSYTLGAVPARPDSVIVDMRRMNRILELDLDNLHITVEPGVTWATIHAALLPTGYRIGFMGTMSGIQATVGGGLGNNATGHGRGDIGDDLLGLEMVLPDGRVIQTGGRAISPETPTNRGYGPDFTAAFIHDAGAFGIKTKATFRLQRRPRGTAFVCYGFRDADALTAALCETEHLGVAASNMAFSRYHHEVFAGQQPSAAEKKALLAAIIAAAPGKARLARQFATLLLSNNMKFLRAWPYSTFTMVDGFDQASAARGARAIRRVMRRHGGHRLNESLGIVMRAQPFIPIDKLIVGREGECSFPSNFTVPLAKADELVRRSTLFFEQNRADMEKHGVIWTRLFLTLKGMFGLEPILYWHDRMNPLRKAVLSDGNREKWGALPPRDETRAYVIDLRHRMVEALDQLQPIHFQTGKYYDYRGALASDAEWALVDGFKTMLDPARLMNPGAMGLA